VCPTNKRKRSRPKPYRGKSFSEFLVTTPPDVVEEISDLGRNYSAQRHERHELIYLSTPDLW
jgi:hypothetical protein